MAIIIRTFFEFENQLKLYHWQTRSYSRHKSADDLFEDLLAKVDVFVETFQGIFGRVRLTSRTNSIRIQNLTDRSIVPALDAFETFLVQLHKYFPTDHYQSKKPISPSKVTSLLNIRDEMLSLVQQTKYRFTLH